MARVLNNAQFLMCCGKLREQGIARATGPLAFHFAEPVYYAPARYYWEGEDTSVEAMVHGPMYHNDNVF